MEMSMSEQARLHFGLEVAMGRGKTFWVVKRSM